MFKRRPGKPAKEDASLHSRRSAVADSAWSAQDRLRSGVKGAADAVGDGIDRASFPLEKKLLWPLADRFRGMGGPARALSLAAVALVAVAALAVGLNLASSGGSPESTGTQVAVAPEPVVEVKAAVEKPAEPTLHGAAPDFKAPANTEPSEVDPAKAIVKSAPAGTNAADDSAAPPESEPADEEAAAAASTAAARPNAEVEGPPAGPKALAVARDFSDAFVVYETGGVDGDVRRAFGATATPELSRALLQRPPRLPANVEVPKAKVLNVVAGPSQGGVYTVSVSLLRVGSTSELRLDMERLKDKEWRVTNVLG
jgi:hypothetical protein